ncbi:PREDICTED: pinoresinol reductase 1-like [Tarenaya hassleriana]|uniref:pinoresinol reductase 1-like n=1 Tax=Tarenaya hassleriana TaxID=28532 RepID=UPI00053C6CCB|nr:PREDICTED: pinoresinol reductase 1-like [Tarenaya hassleriana]
MGDVCEERSSVCVSGGRTRVLVVGGTGYVGKRIVRACLAEGHETYVLQRPEIGRHEIEKVQMLMSFKKLGAKLVEASFSDHRSLVSAVKLVDVVISAVSGVHFRSHSILLQLKLVDAIKEAGNVKRFLPSEYGMDPSRMGKALPPGRETFDEKMEVRRAIEAAGIPHTYVLGACLASYFAGSLSQLETLFPPKEKVTIYGDGNVKVVFVDEDDMARYIAKTVDDPRTVNKTVYVRPPDNVLTHMELVGIWEKLSGKELDKTHIHAHDFLSNMKHLDNKGQKAGIGFMFHLFYEGCLTNFHVGEDEEASSLYPDVKYTRMVDYLRMFL